MTNQSAVAAVRALNWALLQLVALSQLDRLRQELISSVRAAKPRLTHSKVKLGPCHMRCVLHTAGVLRTAGLRLLPHCFLPVRFTG